MESPALSMPGRRRYACLRATCRVGTPPADPRWEETTRLPGAPYTNAVPCPATHEHRMRAGPPQCAAASRSARSAARPQTSHEVGLDLPRPAGILRGARRRNDDVLGDRRDANTYCPAE